MSKGNEQLNRIIELDRVKGALISSYTKCDGQSIIDFFQDYSLMLKKDHSKIDLIIPQNEGMILKDTIVNNKVTEKHLAKIEEIYFASNNNYRMELINENIEYYLEFVGDFEKSQKIASPNRLLHLLDCTCPLYLISACTDNGILRIKTYSTEDKYKNTQKVNNRYKIIIDISDIIR